MIDRDDTKRAGVFTRRALLMLGGQTVALGLLATKLYKVQVVDGEKFSTMAEDNRVSARLLAPPRGRILDRTGEVVAGNKLNWRALLVAEQTDDFAGTIDAFARVVPLVGNERARIERELHRHRRFVPIMMREFLTWEEMARIEVNAPDLPGVIVDVGTSRFYPFSEKLAHLVGYVAPPNDDDVEDDPMLALPGIRVGRAGMEKADDEQLRGKAGVVQLEVNAVGRVIRELDRQEGVAGQDLTLTLDYELQKTVANRLGDESASAVVMDCRNGEVLAMSSNPSFDPSLFNAGVSQAQWVAWTSNRKAPLINKASAGVYAPGSTFKMAVALAGLEAKAITLNDRISCPGYLDLGTARFHCWYQNGHGALDLHGGLKNSCDVFFYEVAKRTGVDKIAAMAHRLGMGTDLDLDLPGARPGLIPTREWRISKGHYWNLGDTVVTGIGQGYVQVTPLALAVYASRVATGRIVKPHFTRLRGGVLEPGSQAADYPDLGLPDKEMRAVRAGMFAVVNEGGGTAPGARIPAALGQLAGKTGSSQVRRVSREVRERGGFNSMSLPWEYRPHALFVCYAPYDNPKYALSVVVEHGNAGAGTAAPIARDLMIATLTRDPAARDASERVASKT